MGYSPEKTEREGVEDILTPAPPPGIFDFLRYPWKFQTTKSSTPWNSITFLLDPLEISRTKSKTPGDSTLFFHP